MASYLIPSSIEFGYGGFVPVLGSRAVYGTGPREIRFTFASDDGAKGTITVPLEESDTERTLTELVAAAMVRAKALVEQAD